MVGRLAEPCRAAVTNTFKLHYSDAISSNTAAQPAEPSNESYIQNTGHRGTRQKSGAFLGLWALNAC